MIKLFFEYDNIQLTIDEKWIESICILILNENGHRNGNITFVFSNDNKLNKLKKEYFGEDILTDTISFNLEEEGEPLDGEVYISIDRVLDNANTFMQDFNLEFKRIVIHSCLHLLGYNDESKQEKIQMNKLEDMYLSKIVSSEVINQ